jgi:signal peptidase I
MDNVDVVKSIIDKNGDTVEYNYPTNHKKTIDTTRTILESEYGYIHPSSQQFKQVTTSV